MRPSSEKISSVISLNEIVVFNSFLIQSPSLNVFLNLFKFITNVSGFKSSFDLKSLKKYSA